MMSVKIVLGPSSSGKSTFIETHYPGVSPNDVLFAHQFDRWPRPRITENSIIHLNMFHIWKNDPRLFHRPINRQPLIRKLKRNKHQCEAIVLVVQEDVLLKRMLARKTVTDACNDAAPYTAGWFSDFLKEVPLCSVYQAWLDFIDRQNMPVQFYHAHDGLFLDVRDVGQALAILSAPA